MKLTVILGKLDLLRIKYKNMVNDYTVFFSKGQGAFKGHRNTYVAREGMLDDPSKKSYSKVVTTVDEKIDYFIPESSEFIKVLMAQEKTNSSGVAQAELIVDGKSWGIFSSLELLRLKSLIEATDLGKLEPMLAGIPVRSDSEIWTKSTAEEYSDRNVWEKGLESGVSKTSDVIEYIMEDPNISKINSANYTPKISKRTKVYEVGDYTRQEFSGEWSQRERAYALKRRNTLLIAVTAALKEANDCEVIYSELTAEKIFGYIFKGE